MQLIKHYPNNMEITAIGENRYANIFAKAMLNSQRRNLFLSSYILITRGTILVPVATARGKNVLSQSAHLFTSAFANQNVQKTIEK